jgi:hypothetical protein
MSESRSIRTTEELTELGSTSLLIRPPVVSIDCDGHSVLLPILFSLFEPSQSGDDSTDGACDAAVANAVRWKIRNTRAGDDRGVTLAMRRSFVHARGASATAKRSQLP